MSKKIYKWSAIVLSVAGYLTLLLPLAKVTERDGCTMIIRGFNMVEFSPWGSIVLSVPLIIIAILFSHMEKTHKTIGLISVQLLNSVGLYNSINKAYEWINSISPEYIHRETYPILYGALILISLICLYAYNEIEEAEDIPAKTRVYCNKN